MKKLILAVLFFSSIGNAKTLIVSDIDDTIKVSHVRDKTDMVANALITTAAFLGMSDVYKEVLLKEDSEIIYVTNALNYMMKTSHTNFIKKNFPLGKVFLKKTGHDDHKYDTIKKFLLENPITQVILVGDNAEQDILFYDRIYNEFKDKISIRTYIRIAYSMPDEVLPLKENQIPFVTALDILSDLYLNDWISKDRYQITSDKLALEISKSDRVDSKKPQYFPDWLNCKGFQINILPELLTENLIKAYQKVESICQ